MTFIITLLQFSITFTFQYGSNQIEVGGVEVTGNGRFTFQYGSNQMQSFLCFVCPICPIYIPIWF